MLFPGKSTGLEKLWIGQAHVESGATSGDLCCVEILLMPETPVTAVDLAFSSGPGP
jgi:hypothetical protein